MLFLCASVHRFLRINLLQGSQIYCHDTKQIEDGSDEKGGTLATNLMKLYFLFKLIIEWKFTPETFLGNFAVVHVWKMDFLLSIS
jgi:hypothetical protein